ncbi:hypothetical protein [Mesoplasma seiffertii]|uniref:hypothetical protein n=1 Tax=Mesoplasma seiffertii TaxID=28224 RepID=UPI00146FAFE5|nr:hypothetical protein [Mesoplasma seiffertii]
MKTGINNNIIHQFYSQILKYSKQVVYIDKNWVYSENNNETYQIINGMLWDLIKDITVILNNLIDWNNQNFKLNLVGKQNIFKFVKPFRNIIHHEKIDRLTFKKINVLIKALNKDIIDCNNDFLYKRLMQKGSAIFYNVEDKRDFISLCEYDINSQEIIEGRPNIKDQDFQLILDTNSILLSKKPIKYFSTRFLVETLEYEGEMNSADIFICYVQFNEGMAIRIKMFSFLYLLLDTLSNSLLTLI